MKNYLSILAVVSALSAAPLVSANVFTITGGTVDSRATATSGKQGSSSGVVLIDPSPTSIVVGGISVSSTTAVAGPVAPGALVTLPGTSGVSTGMGTATVNTTMADVIDLSLSASNHFASLDGGVYQGFGRASSRIDFTVPETVDYSLSGSFDVDPQDLLWKLQLSGGSGSFLFNNATESADSGVFFLTGTLQPGITYSLNSSVSIADTISEGSGVISLSQIDATFALDTGLNVIPEPSSMAFWGAFGIAFLVFNRRQRG
jgi:hypothetical protein